MAMSYKLTILFLNHIQQMPTVRRQIINLLLHMTPAVSLVDATGHAAVHSVPRNATHFPINYTQKDIGKKPFSGAKQYRQIFQCELSTDLHRLKQFSGAFAKLRKATISFVTSLSVCLSFLPSATRIPLDGFP
jgi:hypothetical protein